MYRGKGPVVSKPQKNVGIFFCFVLAIDVVIIQLQSSLLLCNEANCDLSAQRQVTLVIFLLKKSFFTLEWLLYHHHHSLLTSSADFLYLFFLIWWGFFFAKDKGKKNKTDSSKVLIDCTHTHTHNRAAVPPSWRPLNSLSLSLPR